MHAPDAIASAAADSDPEGEAVAQRLRALRGDFSADVSSWRNTKWQLLVFVSSTFTDTSVERNILMERILPRLRRQYRRYEIEINFVDMRWGARDENTRDHKTWVVCSAEIDRCRRDSAGLFFLSLQSEKYGYCSLPRVMSADTFESAVLVCSEDVRELARSWYRLDRNSTQSEYVLRDLDDSSADEFWSRVLPTLISVFDSRECHSEMCPDLIINRSVTEWEVRYALQETDANSNSRSLWFHRIFSGGVPRELDSRSLLCDAHTESIKLRMQVLKAFMSGVILPDRIDQINITATSYVSNIGSEFDAYTKIWEENAEKRLLESIELVRKKRVQWERDGCGMGISGVILQEIFHHMEYAVDKCSTFFGRDHLIQHILRHIEAWQYPATVEDVQETCNVSKMKGVCLSIIGKSGSGKTALMAKVASHLDRIEREINNLEPRPVIVRFCGISPSSSDALSLLTSICHQISIIFAQDRMSADEHVVDENMQNYDDVVKCFHLLLQKHAVLLIIDSLDQLSDTNQARNSLNFLTDLIPHERTKILVSSLPDEKTADGSKWLYCYGCDTRLFTNSVPRLDMPAFGTGDHFKPIRVPSTSAHSKFTEISFIPAIAESFTEAKDILTAMLAQKQRQLSTFQMTLVLENLMFEPTALYINLASKIVSTWKDYGSNDTSDFVLMPTVKGIITQIFEFLEREYGKMLTRLAFSLITYSQGGISDVEMEDLISLDDAVLNDVFQYHVSKVLRLPTHVWLRLRTALGDMISERHGGCIMWYHRQIRETAFERYADMKEHAHMLMGKYFGNLLDAEFALSRHISLNPIRLTDLDVWFDQSIVNKRRCVEAGYHLVSSNMLREAVTELCNPEVICAACKVDEGFNLVRNFSRLMQKVNRYPLLLNEYEMTQIENYHRWLREDINTIVRDPAVRMFSSVTSSQPRVSIARKHLMSIYEQWGEVGSFEYAGWIRCKSLGGRHNFSSLIATIVGHENWVASVAMSPNMLTIASGSVDLTVRCWDIETGELLRTMDGHTLMVTSVVYSPDGLQIASGSRDSSVRVWDSSTGGLIAIIDSIASGIQCLRYRRDGLVLVSGHEDGSICMWDSMTYSNIPVLKWQGHLKWTSCISFSNSEKLLVSCSWDHTISLWDANTGNAVVCVNELNVSINSVAWSSEDLWIASGSEDKIVRLWNAASGSLVREMFGHTGNIQSVMFNFDGSKIVSASSDMTIRIWETHTGSSIGVLEGHTSFVSSLCMGADKYTLISGGYDSTIRVWDLQFQESEEETHDTREGHSGRISCVAFSPDSLTIASGSEDNTLCVWDSLTGSVLRTISLPVAPSASFLMFSPMFLSAALDGVTSVTFNSTGSHILAGSNDQHIRIWETLNGEEIISFGDHDGPITSVSYSPDDSKIAAGAGNYLSVWGITVNSKILNIDHPSTVSTVAWSTGGSKIISGCADGHVRAWDLSTGRLLFIMSSHTDRVNSVMCSKDDTYIASGSNDHTAILWNASNGQIVSTLSGHCSWVTAIAFSYNNKYLVTAANRQIYVWSLEKKAVLHILEGHMSIINCVGVSADSKTIISCSDDKSICLWEIYNNPTENR